MLAYVLYADPNRVIDANPPEYEWVTTCYPCALTRNGETRNQFSRIPDDRLAAHLAGPKHEERVAQYRIDQYRETHHVEKGDAHVRRGADAW